MTMNDCLFCKIVRKELPATVLHEDDAILAFLDIKPVNPGHLLIIPKAHADDWASTPEGDLAAVAVAARRFGRAAMDALGAAGFNATTNNGRAAGQAVGHMHLHVIPRFEGDGHELWHGRPYEEGEMAQVAEKLKQALS